MHLMEARTITIMCVFNFITLPAAAHSAEAAVWGAAVYL